MKKTATALLSLTLVCASVFAFASCGRPDKKLKEVTAEAQEATFTEYQTKYKAAVQDVLYVKSYAKATANGGMGEEKVEMSFSVDGDYAWKKQEEKIVLDGMAMKTAMKTKTTDAGATAEETADMETYVRENTGYLKMKAADKEMTQQFPLSSIDSLFGPASAADALDVFTELFEGGYAEAAENENFKIYAYSDDSGSGFRVEYSMDSAALSGEAFEGLEEFLEIFGETGALTAAAKFSVFFDAGGKLDYAETELEVSVSGTAADDAASDSQTSLNASFKLHEKTSVEKSSTVKYPSDLDSYGKEQ